MLRKVKRAKEAKADATREVKVNGIYRHFKGNYYIVVNVATHSETKEKCVVYRQLYGEGELWVRPMDLFLGEVDHKKYPNVKQKYRFELRDVTSVTDWVEE